MIIVKITPSLREQSEAKGHNSYVGTLLFTILGLESRAMWYTGGLQPRPRWKLSKVLLQTGKWTDTQQEGHNGYLRRKFSSLMCYPHYQALWIPRVSKQSTVIMPVGRVLRLLKEEKRL